jgi:phage FluMu gp28-like protein
VGPSWRQAKLIIRRITYFVRNLPPGMVFKPLRTVIRFTNGSVIEAFPNNPDTIRGPTLDVVYCDEMNFLPNDIEMYDAILFTISTRKDAKFICSSTPWNKDSIFWKIFNHRDYEDFAKHHVTWQQALEPNGPLKKKILDKIRKQFAEDPWRWKREMEAEWAEDETTWLPQSLITRCIDGDLEPWSFDSQQRGKFYAGLDLGKLRDYSVLIVVEEVEGRYLLRHWKVFALGTKYATVIGYVKTLMDRWKTIQKVRVDITGVGEYIVEDMQNAGIEEVEGVTFTLPRKQEMASLLKQRMLDGAYRFPFVELRLSPTVLLSYVAELNVERFELRKDGTIAFNHPQGTHDDTFWSSALALYCSVKMAPEPYLGVVPR